MHYYLFPQIPKISLDLKTQLLSEMKSVKREICAQIHELAEEKKMFWKFEVKLRTILPTYGLTCQ